MPCLENAVMALSKIENSAAVCEAISFYEEQMQKHLKLPTNTVEELLEVHKVCEREAVAKFMAQAFLDNLKTYQEELQVFHSCASLIEKETNGVIQRLV